jgi:hypothetical protein
LLRDFGAPKGGLKTPVLRSALELGEQRQELGIVRACLSKVLVIDSSIGRRRSQS